MHFHFNLGCKRKSPARFYDQRALKEYKPLQKLTMVKQGGKIYGSAVTDHCRTSRLVFTALHGMQTRSCDKNSVRPSVRLSVRLSVKRVHCDKTEESYV